MKYGLAILTYAPEARFTCRVLETLRTVYGSGYPGQVIVVEDGSKKSWNFDRKWNVKYVRRFTRGGVSRGKNTCINELLKLGVDVGFLADDDVEFKPGWWKQYLRVHKQTNIQHLSWADSRKGFQTVDFEGMSIKRTEHLNGCLLTFTPEAIEKVGGFEVRDVLWGWDHVNWTNRMVMAGMTPFYADVVDSHKFVGLNNYSSLSAVPLNERRKGRDYNYPKVEKIFREIEE